MKPESSGVSTMRVDHVDAVVVGSGAAGLSAARQLLNRNICIVTRDPPTTSGSTFLARGGVAAAIGEDDSPDLHLDDTLSAGGVLCDDDAVGRLVDEGVDRVLELVELGVPFDRHPSGEIALGREAAHSRRRILHAGGDRTGEAILAGLRREVYGAESPPDLIRGSLRDLVVVDGSVRGVVVRDENEWRIVLAPAVILATGGLGHLFARTTNPPSSVGAGIAVAYRAGAVLTDLEFVQFHPTALDVPENPLPLLSEALRGEGAILLAEDGGATRRFMPLVHPDAELAPRDVVSRAVAERLRRGQRVFLDLSPILSELAHEFPEAHSACVEAGITDFSRVPVTPAAHYHMGGVRTDLEGRTSLPGLWACGELACTGVHGANRLASNSLLEALVFGRRAGRDVAAASHRDAFQQRCIAEAGELVRQERLASRRRTRPDADDEIRRMMWECVGVMRDDAGLRAAVHSFSEWEHQLPSPSPVRDRALVARLVASSALLRTESRGGHWREDFPRASGAWRGHLAVAHDSDSGTGAADCSTFQREATFEPTRGRP